MVNRNALMGACTLTPEDLRGFHWSILLKFAKNSGRCWPKWFVWGCAMGPALWPQRWELLYSHPIGMKVWRWL